MSARGGTGLRPPAAAEPLPHQGNLHSCDQGTIRTTMAPMAAVRLLPPPPPLTAAACRPLRCRSAAQADSGAPTIFDKIISKQIPAQVRRWLSRRGAGSCGQAHACPLLPSFPAHVLS